MANHTMLAGYYVTQLNSYPSLQKLNEYNSTPIVSVNRKGKLLLKRSITAQMACDGK